VHNGDNKGKELLKFKFQDLETWQVAIEIADDLDIKRLYRFAEQLCGAGSMNISNTDESGMISFLANEYEYRDDNNAKSHQLTSC